MLCTAVLFHFIPSLGHNTFVALINTIYHRIKFSNDENNNDHYGNITYNLDNQCVKM